MFKRTFKTVLALVFLGLPFWLGAKDKFSISDSHKAEIKKYLEDIHKFHDNLTKKTVLSEQDYGFDDPVILRDSILKIVTRLSNFFLQDTESKNALEERYIWAFQNKDSVIREAAAYFYSIFFFDVKRVKLDFVIISLFNDSILNVRRAITYSLSSIFLRYEFPEDVSQPICEAFVAHGLEDKDPIVLGYSILSLIKLDGGFQWSRLNTFYSGSSRFVQSCVIKTFMATVNNAISASWACGLMLANDDSRDLEKFKDLRFLCAFLSSTEKYFEHAYICAWNLMCCADIDKKRSGFRIMGEIFKGGSVVVGENTYVEPFVPKIELKNKKSIYCFFISEEFKSTDPNLRAAALDLCAEFVVGVDNAFDFEVIQYLAIKGFEDPVDDVKLASTKILINLCKHAFGLPEAEDVAISCLSSESAELKAVGLDTYRALVADESFGNSDIFLDDVLYYFTNCATIYSNLKSQILGKSLFNLGKELVSKDYYSQEVIDILQKYCAFGESFSWDMLDVFLSLKTFSELSSGQALALCKTVLNKELFGPLHEKAISVIWALILEKQKTMEIKAFAEELINSKNNILAQYQGFEIYLGLVSHDLCLNECASFVARFKCATSILIQELLPEFYEILFSHGVAKDGAIDFAKSFVKGAGSDLSVLVKILNLYAIFVENDMEVGSARNLLKNFNKQSDQECVRRLKNALVLNGKKHKKN